MNLKRIFMLFTALASVVGVVLYNAHRDSRVTDKFISECWDEKE